MSLVFNRMQEALRSWAQYKSNDTLNRERAVRMLLAWFKDVESRLQAVESAQQREAANTSERVMR